MFLCGNTVWVINLCVKTSALDSLTWTHLNFLFIHLPFLANSVALFYNFGKSWKSDPGIIKATEEQKKKVVMYPVDWQLFSIYSGDLDRKEDTLRTSGIFSRIVLVRIFCDVPRCLVLPGFTFYDLTFLPLTKGTCSGCFQRWMSQLKHLSDLHPKEWWVNYLLN